MAKSAISFQPAATKVCPHIVRKPLKGRDRFYVYAWRGGPRVLVRDGERPTHEEAVEVSMAMQLVLRKTTARPRPRFVRAIMEQCADDPRWAYFIGTPATSIKIGATSDIAARLKILQAHSPVKLKVLAAIRGGEVLESAYHSWFADHRLHGEWFSPHIDILGEIDRINATAKEK